MNGKTIIISGASSGLGKEAALDLVIHGAKVILACRNEEKTNEAMKSLTEEEKKLTEFIQLDLSDFNSIIKFAEEVKKRYNKIDILMNNAGLFPQKFKVTKDNFEFNLQSNFVGHVLLTFLLFDLFDKKDARIINLSSIFYIGADYKDDIKIKEMFDLKKSEQKYFKKLQGNSTLYSNTKLLMLYFSKFLAKLCEEKYTYIKSASLHPGGVATDFFNFVNPGKNKILAILMKCVAPIIKFFFKTPVDGAQTQMYLCYLPFNELISGGYYSDCAITKTKEFANDINKINLCMDLTINEIKKRIPETHIFDIVNNMKK